MRIAAQRDTAVPDDRDRVALPPRKVAVPPRFARSSVSSGLGPSPPSASAANASLPTNVLVP
jgi:hypothetical protein